MSVDFELTDLEKELMDAIRMRRLDRIEDCISRGVTLHFIAGNFEERPLHFAAQQNSPEVIELLVLRGARVDVTDLQGQTPLFHAADRGATEALLALLALKADPNHVAHTRRTAIFGAAKCGCAAAIEALTDNGADPNFMSDGSTPLFWAANGSHYDAAQALVKGGARVDARNSSGFTAGQTVQHRNSNFERDRLLVQFLNAAHLSGTATEGAETEVKILKPISFRMR